MTTVLFIYYVFSFFFMIGVNVRNEEFKFYMCIYLLFFAWMMFPVFMGDYFTSKKNYYDTFKKD